MLATLHTQVGAEGREDLKRRIAHLLTQAEWQQFDEAFAHVPDNLLPLVERLAEEIEKVQALNLLQGKRMREEENKKIDALIRSIAHPERKEEKEDNWHVKISDFVLFGPALSGILFLIYKYKLAHMVFLTFTAQMGVILTAVKCMLPLIGVQHGVVLTATPVLYVVSCALIYLLGMAAVYRNVTTYVRGVKECISLLQETFMYCIEPVRNFINALVDSVRWTLSVAQATGHGIKTAYDYSRWGLGGAWDGSKIVLGTGWYATSLIGNGVWSGAQVGWQGTRRGLGKLHDGYTYLRRAG